MNLLNQVLQGLLLGGYYAVLACGLSFMFGVMRIINLAHGSLAVVAAYLLWWLAEPLGWHPLLALLAVLPAMALLGWALHYLVLERSARLGALVPLLATFGLASVIDNAIGHNEQSTPIRLDVGRAGDVLHFRVIDRGSGVPRADRDRLFEPFQQLDDHHRGGVGLGLAVARGFIEAVGGTITLDDTPGGGLTVDIGLPIASPPTDVPQMDS